MLSLQQLPCLTYQGDCFSVLEVVERAAELGGDPIAEGEAPRAKLRQKHAGKLSADVYRLSLRALLLLLPLLGRRLGRCSPYLVWSWAPHGCTRRGL